MQNPKSSQPTPSAEYQYHEPPTKLKATPRLNKLFSNRLMGWMDERLSMKNMSRSKDQFSRKFGMPQDSKIYHYSCRETYRIGNQNRAEFTEEHEKELTSIQNRQIRGLMACGAFTLLYGVGSLYTRMGPKWGRLTTGNRIHHLAAYSLLLQAINFVEMDHVLGVFQVLLKYNKFYEQALTKYEGN